MQSRRITVPLREGPIPATSGLLDVPAGEPVSAVLLANGAGYDMEAPFMAAVAHGLVERGRAVLRFNYPYKEREVRGEGRRPPDRQPVLEAAHADALAVLLEQVPGRRVLLAGKSLGARMASHLAAKGAHCEGLVFFGFPLHAPNKPGAARAEHFAAIAQPALFLQGTRDALCDLELLERSLERYGGRATVEVIEGADHSFHVPKRSGRSDAEVLEGMLERVVEWEGESWP